MLETKERKKRTHLASLDQSNTLYYLGQLLLPMVKNLHAQPPIYISSLTCGFKFYPEVMRELLSFLFQNCLYPQEYNEQLILFLLAT